MPRKTEPKYGYQERSFLGSDTIETFSADAVDRIATAHAIPDDQRPALKRFLEAAADIYRAHLNNFDEAPRPKHMRAAIAEIRELAERLTEKLNQLDDRSWRFLWQPEAEVQMLARPDGPETSPYGHTFQRWQMNEEHTIVSYIERKHIEESLRILAAYGRAAEEQIPHDPGSTNDRAVYMWVLNAHGFWTRELGRKFTYDAHQGRGLTPAFAFCRDTLRELGATVADQNIGTQMRKVVRERRRIAVKPPI